MNKLSKQSPLYDIVNRLNEIIDEINNNREIYENFKPDIKEVLSENYDSEALPVVYEVRVMGIYKIELVSTAPKLQVELYRNGKTEIVILNNEKTVIDNVFFAKGDKVIIKNNTLMAEDKIVITMKMNILDAFVDQYEAVKTNIEIVSGISEKSEKQFKEMKDTIANFYSSINFEAVTQNELKILLSSLEA